MLLSSVDRVLNYVSLDARENATRRAAANWLASLSNKIESYIDSGIQVQARTEKFNVTPYKLEYLLYSKIVSITSVRMLSLDGNTYTDVDYKIGAHNESIVLDNPPDFHVINGLEVQYVGGYASHGTQSVFTLGVLAGTPEVGKYVYGSTTEAFGLIKASSFQRDAIIASHSYVTNPSLINSAARYLRIEKQLHEVLYGGSGKVSSPTVLNNSARWVAIKDRPEIISGPGAFAISGVITTNVNAKYVSIRDVITAQVTNTGATYVSNVSLSSDFKIVTLSINGIPGPDSLPLLVDIDFVSNGTCEIAVFSSSSDRANRVNALGSGVIAYSATPAPFAITSQISFNLVAISALYCPYYLPLYADVDRVAGTFSSTVYATEEDRAAETNALDTQVLSYGSTPTTVTHTGLLTYVLASLSAVATPVVFNVKREINNILARAFASMSNAQSGTSALGSVTVPPTPTTVVIPSQVSFDLSMGDSVDATPAYATVNSLYEVSVDVISGVFGLEPVTCSTEIDESVISGTNFTISSVVSRALCETHPEFSRACEIELNYMEKHKFDFENTSTLEGQTSRRSTDSRSRSYELQDESMSLLQKYVRVRIV